MQVWNNTFWYFLFLSAFFLVVYRKRNLHVFLLISLISCSNVTTSHKFPSSRVVFPHPQQTRSASFAHFLTYLSLVNNCEAARRGRNSSGLMSDSFCSNTAIEENYNCTEEDFNVSPSAAHFFHFIFDVICLYCCCKITTMDKMIFLFYLSYIFLYLFCRCGVKRTVYINFLIL